MSDRYFTEDFDEEKNGNTESEFQHRSKRPGIRIHVDTDLVQLMTDPELPEKSVWYGVQNDILVMCNEVYPDNMKLAFSLESSMRYEAIRDDHMYYDDVMERLEYRTLSFLNLMRSPGQGVVIRLRQGVDPGQAIEDLQTNGLLIKTTTGNYDNDYKALLCISASDIWHIMRLELTNYMHPTRKRFVPFHHF